MASGNSESQTAILADPEMDTYTDTDECINSFPPGRNQQPSDSGDGAPPPDPAPIQPPNQVAVVDPPPVRQVDSVSPDSVSLTTGSFDVTIEGEFPDDASKLLVKITGPHAEGLYWITADSVTKNSDSEISASFSGAGTATEGEGEVFVQVILDTGGVGSYPGNPTFTWTTEQHVAARKGAARQKKS